MTNIQDINEHKVLLKELSLKNYKGFTQADMTFNEELTLLIADNGGGKTSILDTASVFMSYFLSKGIKGEKKFKSSLKVKDVKNGAVASSCTMKLQLSYKYPQIELFKVIKNISDYLDEYELAGKEAELFFQDTKSEDDRWVLEIDNEIIELDEDDQIALEKLHQNETKDLGGEDASRLPLDSDDRFLVAYKKEGIWKPNLYLSNNDLIYCDYYSGELVVMFELNRKQFSIENEYSGKFNLKQEKDYENFEKFIEGLESKIAYIEDYHSSIKNYSENYVNNNNTETLPLLAYYGGSAINTNFDEIGIKYRPQLFQAYENALDSERFDFELFYEWFHSLKEEEPFILETVRNSILSVMNAEEDIYSNLRIERGKLRLDKKTTKNFEPTSINISQFSAGERNVFALVGDLVKRAIELNPVLFEIIDGAEEETHSNLLEYTYGVVMIDEFDLHLHPKWQRYFIPKLKTLFPHVQFLFAFHTPFALQGLNPFEDSDKPLNERKKIVSIKKVKDFVITTHEEAYHYSRNISSISYSLQDVSSRIPEIAKEIKKMYALIDEGKLTQATEHIKHLEQFLSDTDEDIINAKTLIEFYTND